MSSEHRSYLYLLTVFAAVGGFLFGYDLSIIAGAIPFLKNEFSPSPWLLGFAASSAVMGCILGALGFGVLTDRWGRKKALYLGAILLGLSAVGTTLPTTMLGFSIFRIVGGMGVGLISIVSPMYIAEVAPAHLRGRLVWGHQLAIVVGSLASLLVSWLLSFNASWRWMFASELVPILVLLIGLSWMPESPRWLAQRHRKAEARAVFDRIGGSPHADLEMGRIEHLPVRKTGSFADLFQPGIRKALLVACALAVLQQFSGAGPLLLHAPVAFRRAGLETVASDALLQSIVVTSWKLLWTVAGLWAIDRFGRRPLLLTGTSAMALGLALASVFFTDPGGPALLLTMLLVVAGVVVSLAPLAWVMMSEVFPTHLRGKGMTLASLSLWVSAFSGAFLLPAMLSFFKESLGSEAWGFGIFVAVCLFAVAFGWRLVPETKGRSLEEMGESW